MNLAGNVLPTAEVNNIKTKSDKRARNVYNNPVQKKKNVYICAYIFYRVFNIHS